MKNYIQQLIELFGHNNYSADTQKKVQQWLADEEHVDEKNEALHELWKQAEGQRVPDGMQQSIQRMRQNLGMQSVTSRRNYQSYMESCSYFLVSCFIHFYLSDVGKGPTGKRFG